MIADLTPWAMIEPHSDGTYQILQSLTNAQRDPKRKDVAAQLGVCDETGTAFDSCAWFPHDERRWWLLRDEAVGIGLDELWRCGWQERPVVVLPTPAAYVRAVCSGEYGDAVPFSILRWDRFDPRLTFCQALEVQCADADTRRKLDRRLAQLAAPAFTTSTIDEARRAA